MEARWFVYHVNVIKKVFRINLMVELSLYTLDKIFKYLQFRAPIAFYEIKYNRMYIIYL